MTINLIQTESNNSDFSAVNTLSVTPSSATSEGNLLILIISNRGEVGAITWPSGFTERNSQLKSGVAIKIAGSSEPSSYVVSWSGDADTAAIGFLEYSGIDSSDLIDVEASNSGTGTSLSSGTTPATDQDDELALAIFCGENASQFISPTYTNSFSQVLSSRRGNFTVGFIYAAERTGVSASIMLETTATATSGSGSPMWAYIVSFHNGPLIIGAPVVTNRTSTTASLSSPAGSGGAGPYTYQWHRSTISGFTPGVGTQISGATSLTLEDTGLTDGVTYYYIMVVTDNSATEVESAEVSVTTSSVPSVIITDDEGNDSGIISIMSPGCVSFEVTKSLLGSGLWTDCNIEWDFGDIESEGNIVRGYNAGHIYNIEPEVDTDFTVTCTITNSLGSSASATRTVRVTPNTRRVVFVDPDTGSASPMNPTDINDPYNTIANCWAAETITDLEIRMAAGKTHFWTTSIGSGSSDNVHIRSTVGGTFFQVSLQVDPAVQGGPRMGIRDAKFIESFFGSQARILSPRLENGFRCYAINCHSSDPDVAMCYTGATSKSTVLTNTSTNHSISGDVFFTGNNLTIINHSSDYSGIERPFRGSGKLATFNSCVAHYDNIAGKTAFTRDGGLWCWIDKCEFYADNENAGSGTPLQIGHSSNTFAGGVGPQYVVVERTLCALGPGVAGTGVVGLHIGGEIQTVFDVAVRNCIIKGSNILVVAGTDPYHVERVWLLHNTVETENINIIISHKQHDVTVKNCLGIGYVSATEAISLVDSMTSNPVITNNVMPAVINGDIRVDNAVTRLSWAEFNVLGIGTGNLSKDVTYNVTTYRPNDTEDSDLLKTPPAEMGAVPEDYYGNPRTGEAWIAGAVGEIPPTPPTPTPTVSIESVSAGTIEFTAIVSYVDGTDDNYTSIFSKDGSFVEFGASIPDLIDRISRDISVRSFLNAIGVSTTVKPQNPDVNGVSWRFQVKSESGKTMAAWSETHVDDYYFLSEYGVGYWGFLATDGGVSALFDRLI